MGGTDEQQSKEIKEGSLTKGRRKMELNRSQAEDFLYHEADLLDRRDYNSWLSLFTEDSFYWLPMDENDDPLLQSSILYDDNKMRAMRVHQLLHKSRYAQIPPSRTVHAVSNVRVKPDGDTQDDIVLCTVMVTELREGNYVQFGLGNQRVFSAHGEYRLRQGSDGPLIALKKLVLINRDLPIENLSFIL